MKKLILALLLLFAAVWLGFLIHRDPGYILVTYHLWSIETSLWVGVALLLIAFIIFYMLLRFFSYTARFSITLQTWNKARRERRSDVFTNKGFSAFIEKQWSTAEVLFSKSANDSACAVINYAAAAYSAQQLSAYERRNEYLAKLAQQSNSSDKIAKLIESYFYIDLSQWEEARHVLQILEKEYPKDPAVLCCLAKTLEKLQDWEALKNLLPLVEKQCSSEYKELSSQVYSHLLKNVSHPERLDQMWATVPKAERTHHLVAYTYAIKALEFSRDHEAANVVENALKKNWQANLIKCYGHIYSDRVNKQISHAESWLKKYPNDVDVLICLGRLCMHEKLWEKARDYLMQALEVTATTEVYYELGQLFEAMGSAGMALEYYRKAAQPENLHAIS